MANITRLTEQLFTGGDLPSHLGDSRMLDDLSEMREAGLTHIIDNRSEWSDEQFVNDHAAGLDTIRDARPIAAIGYGADALDWWHRRSGAAEGNKARERTALWD